MQTGFDASRCPLLPQAADSRPQPSTVPAHAAETLTTPAATESAPRVAAAVATPPLAPRDGPGPQPAPASVPPALSDRPVRVPASEAALPQEPGPGPGPGPGASSNSGGASTSAAAPIATVVRPIPVYPLPLSAVYVNDELHYPRARVIDGPGPLVIRQTHEPSTGLLATDVVEHFVLMMVGPAQATGPGPGSLMRLTGMVMVDPEHDDYLEQAGRALAEFQSRAGGPVTVHLAFDVESTRAMVESQMSSQSLETLLARFRIAERPPSVSPQAQNEWTLDQIEAAHVAAAEDLAERLGGQAINMPHCAVFLDPIGEVDTFEDEPDVRSPSEALGIVPGAEAQPSSIADRRVDPAAVAATSSSLARREPPRSPSPESDWFDDNASTESDATQMDPSTPGSAAQTAGKDGPASPTKGPGPSAGAPPK